MFASGRSRSCPPSAFQICGYGPKTAVPAWSCLTPNLSEQCSCTRRFAPLFPLILKGCRLVPCEQSGFSGKASDVSFGKPAFPQGRAYFQFLERPHSGAVIRTVRGVGTVQKQGVAIHTRALPKSGEKGSFAVIAPQGAIFHYQWMLQNIAGQDSEWVSLFC